MQILITTKGLNTRESKCLYLGELSVFQVIKNEMPFLPLLPIYKERFDEKYSK
jgi:hypothetical protein